MTQISLENKVALVTGSSRGIGRACALMLAGAGCSVLIHYEKSENAALVTSSSIEKLGVKSASFRADMRNRSQVKDMVEFAISEFGRVDILVNNAGVWEKAAIEKMTEEDLKKTLETNLNGVFHACSAVVPHMKKQGSGSIINIASTAGQRGEAFYSHYAASKAALIGLTKSLGPELAPHGIRVNCVAPGWVRTDMSKEALSGGENEDVLRQIPLGRVGRPEEIAGCVLFLASDLSSFVTGEILNANGGAVLCG